MRQEEFINGYAEHPYGLPGIECNKCGQIWSNVRVLPYSCPEQFKSKKEVLIGSPIPSSDHRLLQQDILHALNKGGLGVKELGPGDDFQPVFLDIKTKPKADFLWSALGSVLVSERIKVVFENQKVSGITFVPVIMRKVGNKNFKYPFDIISDNITYFEMIINTSSKYPPGAEIHNTCDSCGREEFDSSKRKIEMNSDMWNGEDVFFLNTTLWIIVTNKVKAIIEDLKATNIIFESCSEKK